MSSLVKAILFVAGICMLAIFLGCKSQLEQSTVFFEIEHLDSLKIQEQELYLSPNGERFEVKVQEYAGVDSVYFWSSIPYKRAYLLGSYLDADMVHELKKSDSSYSACCSAKDLEAGIEYEIFIEY